MNLKNACKELSIAGEILVVLVLVALGGTLVRCLIEAAWLEAAGFFLLAATLLFSVRDML